MNIGSTTNVNAAEIDLADFGVESASIVTLTSTTSDASDADPTAPGALNTAARVPSLGTPVTLALAAMLVLCGRSNTRAAVGRREGRPTASAQSTH
ncbi:MAG: hypothetical protein QNK04_18910 [Myxococcota bacterium]|nr:hypothetical protein [Myxococcota bacterium]